MKSKKEIEYELLVKKFKEKQDIFGFQIELTKELKSFPFYRRLDSLARLFERKTNCAAVSTIDGKFLISVNKIIIGKSEQDPNKVLSNQKAQYDNDVKESQEANNNLISFISSAMGYFKEIATKNLSFGNNNETWEMFKQIASMDRFVSIAKGSKLFLDENKVNSIVEAVFKEEDLTTEEIFNKYGRDNAIPLVVMEAKSLYNDFKKVSQAIQFATEGNFSKITEEQFNAFKNNNPEIKTCDKENHHAEMLVLSKLKNASKTEGYIGISKPCCLNCHLMLSIVNNSGKTNFIVRGWHDKSDPSDPTCFFPDLQDQYSNLKKEKTNEATKLQKNAPVNVNRKYSLSDSSDGEGNGEALFLENRKYLNTQWETFGGLFFSLIKKNIMPIHFGLSLHKDERIKEPFSKLFNILPEKEMEPIVNGFLMNLKDLFDIQENKQIIKDFFAFHAQSLDQAVREMIENKIDLLSSIELIEKKQNPMILNQYNKSKINNSEVNVFSIHPDKFIEESRKMAEKKGVIGHRQIDNFELKDVKDEGNCFYEAVAEQLQLIKHKFVSTVPFGTDVHNSLRLAIQGEGFKDQEWAEDQTIDTFVREFKDVILAIIDTRNPNAGFVCHYWEGNEVITNTGNIDKPLPSGRGIVRIAATGNHFLSVISHPKIDSGAISDAFNQPVAGSKLGI